MKKYIHLIRQHDETDCGAACMSMILQHYGKKLPLPVLREAVGVDQYGANMLGLNNVAEKYGLSATFMEGTADELMKDVYEGSVHLPFIAQIQNAQGYEHFIVISAVSHDKLYCCDPGEGCYELSTEEFHNCFLEHIMMFRKTDTFTCENNRYHSSLRFLQLIAHQKALLCSVALLSCFVTGVGLLGSFVFQFLVDNVMSNLGNDLALDENLDMFAVLITGVAVAYLLRFISQMLRGRLMTYMVKRINLPLMLGYYDHVMDLPMNFFSTRKTGDLISRFHDATKVQEALTNATLTILIDTVMVMFCGVVLYKISPTLFFITLVILALYVLISILYIKPMGKRSRKLMAENGELSSFLKESIDGVQTVKAFQAEKSVKNRMKTLFVDIQNDGIKFSLMGLGKDALIEMVASIGILVLLWAGTCSVIEGIISLGSLITFYTLLSYFLSPVQNLIELQSVIQEAVIAADRLNDILDASLEDNLNATKKLRSGNVVLENIAFRYGNRDLTLENFSMNIEQGQHVALVGGSGSGKTTVSKLLMGFYKAESGSICMGDVNIDEICISELRNNIAYVPQETFLFSSSIRDNLLLGDIDVEEKQLENVLDACGCDFVKSLPLGIDTMLEENGANLSGGQRQRLAIARAMLRNPRILILDEATSSLDSLSENRVMESVHALNPDMTVIMSAHRLNTVRGCDKIFVLEKGKVVEEGNHEYLISASGLYKKMWESQNN